VRAKGGDRFATGSAKLILLFAQCLHENRKQISARAAIL
jgi:hypothetical protein